MRHGFQFPLVCLMTAKARKEARNVIGFLSHPLAGEILIQMRKYHGPIACVANRTGFSICCACDHCTSYGLSFHHTVDATRRSTRGIRTAHTRYTSAVQPSSAWRATGLPAIATPRNDSTSDTPMENLCPCASG